MFFILCLDTTKVEITRRFYQQLGYEFALEKHETGPAHYTMTMPQVSVEIYPGIKGLPQGTPVIGIEIDNPKQMKAELIEKFGGMEAEPSVPNTPSGIATLCDPSGALVRLFPKS